MKKTRFGFLLLILVLFPVYAGAVDYGLLLNQYGGFRNSEDNEFVFDYSASLIPRFSFLIGDMGSFFMSASLNIGYMYKFYFYPELLRTELSLNFGQIGMNAGRITYSAPFDYIAAGLFDGIQFSHSSGAGHFGLGAWYTGLQYKKSANIVMTSGDQLLFSSELDYSNFFETYFAPKRLLASAFWEHPSIGEIFQFNAAVLGQVDFSEDDIYHNQYLMLKVGFPFDRFLFELGGSLEAAQMKRPEITAGNGGTPVIVIPNEYSFKLAFSGELGFYWTLPTNFNSRFSFVGRYTSGEFKDNEILGAFIPVTSKSMGEIFTVKMSGITVLSLDYSARIVNGLGTVFSFSYFIRNDLETLHSFPLTSELAEHNLLGGELYARFVFSPMSDLQVKLSGGAFFPQMGNIWTEEKILWKMDITAILSLY